MTGLLGRLKETVQLRADRHRNRPFLEATMATSALVAFSDGSVSFSERYRVDQILEHLDQLRAFDPHEAVDLFNDYVEALRERPEEARAQALAAIVPFAEDPDAARLIVRIGAAISQADGVFTESERTQIEEICATLGLTLQECEF